MTEHTVNLEDTNAATDSPCPSQAPTTANLRPSLNSAIARHIRFEKASFHTPGHKGRQAKLFANLAETHLLNAAWDVTELPGLDDLSAPEGVIADLQERASTLWGSAQALVSVNGASAALTAAILATAAPGSHALVPRNAHHSVVNALCLARLTPIWYEPHFENEWGIWGAVQADTIADALAQARAEETTGTDFRVACAVVVSPTYAGAISDIAAIVKITKSQDIPLIVDEAHGAHLLYADARLGAIACGADAVAHSWHKTLPALTQTGMLHLSKNSLLDIDAVKSSLNLITSSSPSYLLLASMAATLALLESGEGTAALAQMRDLATRLASAINRISQSQNQNLQIYAAKGASGNNYSHLLVKSSDQAAHHLYDFLQDRGVFAEAIMGAGVLFILGLGSNNADISIVLDTINAYGAMPGNALENPNFLQQPPALLPVLPPHQAMLMRRESVSVSDALGRIAAQCLSPCPPGIPILIPGQKITEEVLELVSDKTIMVVAHRAGRSPETRRN